MSEGNRATDGKDNKNMNKITAIAGSLKKLYDMDIIRLDIQYSLVLGDVVKHEFQINTDCTFWEVIA